MKGNHNQSVDQVRVLQAGVFKILGMIFILIIAAILVVFILKGKTSAIIQPLPFNHFLHVEEQDIECTTCHTLVEKHERAALPGIEICAECHEEEMTGTETEKRLLGYVTGKREIPWQRIYRVPDHVYFSHRRHVASGKLECQACHGDVKTLKEPSPHPVIDHSMDFCMDCHKSQKVDNDCLTCHR
jgi:hypothetical protein